MSTENEKYHSDTSRISKSGLDLIAKSPAHYYAKYLDPNKPKEKPSRALLFGSAFHESVLENNLFRENYIVTPEFHGIGSQQRKYEFEQVNSGKKILTIDEYTAIQGMTASITRHKRASKFLFEGTVEMQFNWIDEITGAKCKCKPDFFNDYIIDLKTTEDASLGGFRKSGRKYRYYVQDAFYTDGLGANGIKTKGFIFIAVEKKYPYLVNMFIYDNDDQQIGRETYRDNVRTWQTCNETGIWEGYGEDVKGLSIF